MRRRIEKTLEFLKRSDWGRISALMAAIAVGLVLSKLELRHANEETVEAFAVLIVVLLNARTRVSHGGRVTVICALIGIGTIGCALGVSCAEPMVVISVAIFLMFMHQAIVH
jgi:hypothetical protein